MSQTTAAPRTVDEPVAPPPVRLSVGEVTPEPYRAMLALHTAAGAGIDAGLAELVRIRVSQLNGCGFCLDLHTGAARSAGEDPRRLSAVAAWRRTPFFTRRERAALALAEAVTALAGVDDAYDEAAGELDDAELGHLLWTIAAVNAWNRIAVPTRMAPAAAPVPAGAAGRGDV
jgi:AhpD family alkylhydroperoxidase